MDAYPPAMQDTIFPSPQHVALAIAIVKSKPAGVSARDYILQLRAQVKQVSPELDHSRYLDLVSYWKDKYQRAQEECEQIKAAKVRLERSNMILTRLTRSTPEFHSDNPGTAPKRKRESTPQIRRSKRTKTAQETMDQSIASTEEAIDEDCDFLTGLGKDGVQLTQALYTTHKLCQQPNTEPESLCNSLLQTCSALSGVVRMISEHHDQLARSNKKHASKLVNEEVSEFSLALSVSARAFMSVLVGMSKLSSDGDEHIKLTSLVTCGLVEIFKAALYAIETTARQSAQATLAPVNRRSKEGAAAVCIKESAPARALAQFLIGLLSFLDKNESSHQQIFDGYLYVLLERMGRRLFYCTFGRHRSTTIEGDIMPLPIPKTSTERGKLEVESLAIQLEVKALVLILDRAIRLAPHHMNRSTGKAPKGSNRVPRTASLKSVASSSRIQLSPLAKDRLQRTLVTCMYGDKVDDEFLDVLTKPVPAVRLGPVPNVARIDNNEVEDWYKMEVWRLIGWDILAREGPVK